MTGERSARRYPASAFPEIEGIRLVPPGAPATLVNLSASGVLVECASRLAPGAALTVEFEGGFSPASVACRVVRCEVTGIAKDGSLRYHIGLAFGEPIALAQDAEADDDARLAAPVVPPPLAAAVAAEPAPVLRNRW